MPSQCFQYKKVDLVRLFQFQMLPDNNFSNLLNIICISLFLFLCNIFKIIKKYTIVIDQTRLSRIFPTLSTERPTSWENSLPRQTSKTGQPWLHIAAESLSESKCRVTKFLLTFIYNTVRGLWLRLSSLMWPVGFMDIRHLQQSRVY